MAFMSSSRGDSRIERARARTRAFKVTAALGATLLFATAAALARSAHPGAGSAGTSGSGDSLDAPAQLTADLEQGVQEQGVLEPGSIGSSSDTTPQAQTRTS